MDTPAYYLYSLCTLGFVIGVILLGGWALRRFGTAGLARLTGRGSQPRLSVVTALALDPRRRLVIVRRDGVEHLLLLGGTQDLHLEGPVPIAGGDFDAMLRDEDATQPPPPGTPAPLTAPFAIDRLK